MSHTKVTTTWQPDEAMSADGLLEVRLDSLLVDVALESRATPMEGATTSGIARDLDEATDLWLAHAGHDKVGTLRPTRQGGRFRGAELLRLGLLRAARDAGFGWLDVEGDLADLEQAIKRLGGPQKTIASLHLAVPPGRDQGLRLLQRLQDAAEVQKLAFSCGSFQDELRALELAHAHSQRRGVPAIAPQTTARIRALLPLAGNRMTYGAHPQGGAPGQVAMADIEAVWRHWGIADADLQEATTAGGFYAVLGTPIDHSFSPRLHNAALRAAGRPERFGALEVPASSGALRLVAHVASRIGLKGASVTAPHKVDAAKLGQGDETTACGAANCLRFGDDVSATNTDVTAMRRLTKELPGDVLILGSGGAARAAAHALRDRNVTIACRRPESVDSLDGVRVVPWSRRQQRADVIVQATPVGDVATVDPGDATVIELVYAAGATPLERRAKAAVSGRRFLIEQAVDAYRFWFGDVPAVTAMEAAWP